MPWTKSLLELSFSPVEAGSGDIFTVNCDLALALKPGESVNNVAVTVAGGPLDCADLWTDLTSSVYISNDVIDTICTVKLHSCIAGFGYRVAITFNTLPSGSPRTISRFFIVRCLY